MIYNLISTTHVYVKCAMKINIVLTMACNSIYAMLGAADVSMVSYTKYTMIFDAIIKFIIISI